MQRIFGTSKPPPPKPTLNEALQSMDSRGQAMDLKIQRLDAELKKLRDQMARMPEGPSKNGYKKRALALLKQKKMYEGQRDQIFQQTFNIEQVQQTNATLSTTLQTVSAMRDASVEMKNQYKKINIDKIEDMRDEMDDLIEQANEIQEVMSRSYGLPEGLDEDDLEAELAALGDELDVTEVEPSYLSNDASTNVPTTLPQMPSVSDRIPLRPGTDEHGLPLATDLMK